MFAAGSTKHLSRLLVRRPLQKLHCGALQTCIWPATTPVRCTFLLDTARTRRSDYSTGTAATQPCSSERPVLTCRRWRTIAGGQPLSIVSCRALHASSTHPAPTTRNRNEDLQRATQTDNLKPHGQLFGRPDETHVELPDSTITVKSTQPAITTHENIYNIPNFLTATRLVAAPVIGYLVVQGDLKWALGLFVYAGVTDLVDGWMARRFNLQTVVGSVVDPMADKLLMTVLTISLAYKGFLPAYLATLILGRDITLAGAAIYYRYASLPPPKTMLRYWDFSLPSAIVHPTTVSKYNTFLQLVLIGATLTVPVLAAEQWYTEWLHEMGRSPEVINDLITYFQYLVAGTTAWSGLSYAVLKDAVTILGNDEAMKAKQGKRGRAIIGVSFGACVVAALWLALYRDSRKGVELKEKTS